MLLRAVFLCRGFGGDVGSSWMLGEVQDGHGTFLNWNIHIYAEGMHHTPNVSTVIIS